MEYLFCMKKIVEKLDRRCWFGLSVSDVMNDWMRNFLQDFYLKLWKTWQKLIYFWFKSYTNCKIWNLIELRLIDKFYRQNVKFTHFACIGSIPIQIDSYSVFLSPSQNILGKHCFKSRLKALFKLNSVEMWISLKKLFCIQN